MKSNGRLQWAMAVLCAGLATAAQAAFHGRDIERRPDMCNVDIIDTVSWFANESVRLTIEPWRCGERLEIPQGATAAWIVADEGGTNWLARYDLAPAGGCLAFAFGAGEGNLPDGHDYTAFVSLLDGTNVLGVVDRFEVRVLGMAEDSGAAAVMPPDDYPAIVDAVHEYLLRTTDLAVSNAAAISALQAASDALASRADGLDAATDALGARLDSAADAIAANAAAVGGLAGDAANLVPRLEQPSATNRAWAFSPTGTVFNSLSVGGWEYTETIATDTATQTVVRTQTGTLSLNGAGITSWADIIAGCASQDWARQWVAAYVATNHQSLAGYATLADLEGIAADVDLSGVWEGIQAVADSIPSTNALASREWTAAYVATNHQSLAGYATRGYVDDCVGGLSDMLSGITGGGDVDLSGISLQLAGLRVDVDAAAGGVAANASAIGGLQTAAAGLQDAVGGLQDGLGGYLAKTNGDWVAVQSGLWHGLTWAGSELFGAALLVETNQARIAGLQTGSGNTAVITFLVY